MKILITRPKNLAQQLKPLIISYNHEPIICPLLEITNLKKIDTKIPCIITSQHALDCIINKMTKLFVLGHKTAETAISMGFENVVYVGKNIKELKQNIPFNEELLYLSGNEVTEDLSKFPKINREIMYKATKVEKYSSTLNSFLELEEKKAILFFSKRTAEIFINLTKKYRLYNNFSDIISISLSKNISDYLKTYGFKELHTAKEPKLIDLTKLIGVLK
jgi:uroporphyrinogen-III synthase